MRKMELPTSSRSLLDRTGLLYDPQYQALICCRCQYTVPSTGQGVRRHFTQYHGAAHILSPKVVTLIDQLHPREPARLALLPDEGPPHPALRIHHGFGCKMCQYRATSAQMVTRHISQDHHVAQVHSRWARDTISLHLRLQTWTKLGKWGFWKVKEMSDMPSPDVEVFGVSNPSPAAWAQVERLSQEESQRMQDLSSQPSEWIDGNLTGVEAALQRPWVRRTGWTETFNGTRRDLLWSLAQAPTAPYRTGRVKELVLGRVAEEELISSVEDESVLRRVSKAFDHVFARCEETVSSTDSYILRWVQSQHADRPFRRPFALVARKASSHRYFGLWKRLAFFWLRCWRLGDRRCRMLCRRWLSKHQAQMLAEIWEQAQPSVSANVFQETLLPDSATTDAEEEAGALDIEDEDEDSERESSDDETTVDDSRDPLSDKASSRRPTLLPTCAVEAYQDPLVGLLAAWSVSLVSEEYTSGRPASTMLIYAAGVLALRDRGRSFQSASVYTSTLSALIYCSRLLLLEATLPAFGYPYIG